MIILCNNVEIFGEPSNVKVIGKAWPFPFVKTTQRMSPLTMTSSNGLYSILDFSNCRNEAHTLTIAVNPDEHLLSV